MQCHALTPHKRRCPDAARAGARYCAAHANENVRAADSSLALGARGSFLDRVRSVFKTPIYDGGKYDPPKWLNDAATPQVIVHLQTHADSMVRWTAAYILRKRRAVEAIEPLWSVLQHDDTRFVRQQCAVALGKIGTPLVVAPLVEALNHDRDQGVRQACAIALGNLGLPHTDEEIARALEREENIYVKWDCIVALGQLGDRRAEKLLVRLQAEEVAQVVRDACRDSLQEIQQRERLTA